MCQDFTMISPLQMGVSLAVVQAGWLPGMDNWTCSMQQPLVHPVSLRNGNLKWSAQQGRGTISQILKIQGLANRTAIFSCAVAGLSWGRTLQLLENILSSAGSSVGPSGGRKPAPRGTSPGADCLDMKSYQRNQIRQHYLISKLPTDRSLSDTVKQTSVRGDFGVK